MTRGIYDDEPYLYPKTAVNHLDRFHAGSQNAEVEEVNQSPVIATEFRDPEMLAEAIRSAYLEPVQLSSKREPSRLVRVQCERVCLDLVTVGPAMLFTGVMPEGCYTLSYVVASPGGGNSFNFGTEYGEGYMGFFPPGAPLDSRCSPGSIDAILTVPIEVFHAALAAHFPEMPDRILKSGAGMRVGPVERSLLGQLINRINDGVQDREEYSEGCLICDQLERELLPAFIAALRSGCDALTPPLKMRVSRRHRRLRQAREYLSEHQHESIHVEDLCSAVDLSERGVENLFMDLLGMSPAAFLRRQRLHHVRRCLQNANPSSGRIKQVALDAGFWHLGHFSQNYRRLFGECPSETLLSGTR